MVEYSFKRILAIYKGGFVQFSESETLEIIEVASDWKLGGAKYGERKHWETGYIGCGFTKMGIYVSPVSFLARCLLEQITSYQS